MWPKTSHLLRCFAQFGKHSLKEKQVVSAVLCPNMSLISINVAGFKGKTFLVVVREVSCKVHVIIIVYGIHKSHTTIGLMPGV